MCSLRYLIIFIILVQRILHLQTSEQASSKLFSSKSKHVVQQWRTQEFFSGGEGSTNSVEDRERGSGGDSALVRGSGGSCNLVQEIAFHIVKFS
jgi:hypothetical protein